MSNEGRREGDHGAGKMAKLIKEWLPVISFIATLAGGLFVMKDTVAETSSKVSGLEVNVTNLRVSDARQDEQLKAIASMQDDIKRLTNYFIRSGRSRND